MRDGRVIGQTRDHSRVRLLVEQGDQRSPGGQPSGTKQGPQLPSGARNRRKSSSRKTPLETGDVVLLATDGFWGPLPPELLAAALETGQPAASDTEPDEPGGEPRVGRIATTSRWSPRAGKTATSNRPEHHLDADHGARRNHRQARRVRHAATRCRSTFPTTDRKRPSRKIRGHRQVSTKKMNPACARNARRIALVTNATSRGMPKGPVLDPHGDTGAPPVPRKACPFLRGKAGLGHRRVRHAACVSTHTARREAAKGKQSGRTQEIQRLIGRFAARRGRSEGAWRTPDHT